MSDARPSTLLYQDLGHDETRLLKIIDEKELVFEFVTVPITQMGRYIALSYTWGPAVDDEGRDLKNYTITLHDQHFSVLENLYHALTYLAPEVKADGSLFWVDAICINQADLEERRRQVVHMRHLYEHATQVFAWLGVPPTPKAASSAIQMMRKCHIAIRDAVAVSNGDMNDVSTKITATNKDIFPEPGTDCYEAWCNLSPINLSDYWHRTWVWQEATGPATTRFYYGLSWFDLVYLSATGYIAHHFSQTGQMDANSVPLARVTLAFSTFRDKGVFRFGGTLFELLDQFRSLSSSDPRDKIYAPRCLATDISAEDIVPDYAKPVADVYADVVQFSLSRPQHGLEVLGQVQRHPGNPRYLGSGDALHRKLPSWVPDFRKHLALNIFHWTDEGGRPAYASCGPHMTHDARIEGRRLFLTGLKVDTIESISAIWDREVFNTGRVAAWAPQNPLGIYIGKDMQTRDEAFWTTIVGDMNIATMRRGFMVEWNILNASNESLTSEQSSRRNHMHVALISASGLRRLGWTKRCLMGLVPCATEIGDEAFVLRGGRMVYILRRTGDEGATQTATQYEFVGAAYLHGVMDGELFETGSENVEWQELVLV